MRFLLLMPKYIGALQKNRVIGQNELVKTPNFIEKSTSVWHISSFL